MDKEWGLTDCISFLVMQDRAMTDALTTAQHFQQAGFRALLWKMILRKDLARANKESRWIP
jgi:predicted nucleic acid-binding protein